MHTAPRALRLLLSLTFTSLMACGAGGLDGDSARVGSDPNGPALLQLSTNVDVLNGPETLTFSAVVSDPSGIDDVIGGVLLHAGSDNSYGAFQTSASEGAYALSVSWDELNQVDSINFMIDDRRDFVARFYDQAGNVTEQEISIDLACHDDAPACDGECGMERCDDGACAPRYQCGEWTCTQYESSNGYCDCGCGQPDPECPAGADVSVCQSDYCFGWNETLDEQNPHYCAVSATEPLCDPDAVLNSGCVCGCGQVDADCPASGSAADCDYDVCALEYVQAVDPNDLSRCLPR